MSASENLGGEGMLLALDNELRKKAAQATKEAWSETQGEANSAVEQQSAAEITQRLKTELRLDQQEPAGDTPAK